ncbi:MbnP family protein [Tenacibaculum piscium]|uniref:MbnP family protein n=1 Tax=Tenacibaculum piscium TaxID=1458515 RepID=UPI001F332546|nr:MbnP family protein [Tenacibaculum piscium]
MKKIFSLIAIAIAFTFASCNDNETSELTGKNNVSIDFDASFAGENLVLGVEKNLIDGDTKQKLTINAFDYIVGNFVLVTESGEEYVYPKEKSFFIISEGGKKYNKTTKEYTTLPAKTAINLTDVPAGKYTKIKFGVGIDEDTYKGGKQFANNLWERAEEYSLVWAWATGYKFLVLEGVTPSPIIKKEENTKSVSQEAAVQIFKYHVAAAANDGEYAKGKELYKEITLDLTKNPFLVAKDKSPQVHLAVDASKMLTGKNTINVLETPVLMGPKTTGISENSLKMFAFDHLHYNEENH